MSNIEKTIHALIESGEINLDELDEYCESRAQSIRGKKSGAKKGSAWGRMMAAKKKVKKEKAYE